jgi:hypothetical protein
MHRSTRKRTSLRVRPPRLGAAILAAAALAILLSSCTDTTIEISFARDGTGRMKAHYGVAAMMSALQGYEGSAEILTLPLDRASADARARTAQGVTITSFASKQDSEAVTIDLDLGFSSPAALLAFLDPQAKRLHLTTSATGQSIRATLASGQGPGGMDPDLVSFIETAFPRASLSIGISFPAPVKVAGIASASADGRVLTYTSSLPALIESREPVIWEFRW